MCSLISRNSYTENNWKQRRKRNVWSGMLVAITLNKKLQVKNCWCFEKLHYCISNNRNGVSLDIARHLETHFLMSWCGAKLPLVLGHRLSQSRLGTDDGIRAHPSAVTAEFEIRNFVLHFQSLSPVKTRKYLCLWAFRNTPTYHAFMLSGAFLSIVFTTVLSSTR